MAITPDRVREIFKGLENGDGAAFFEQVADDVDWTVMGTHPLAGHYLSKKAFIEGTFAKLGQVLPQGAAAPFGASDRQRRSGGGGASFSSDCQEPHALRQSLLLDRLFPGCIDSTCSCLPRLGHGRPIVRGESDYMIG